MPFQEPGRQEPAPILLGGPGGTSESGQPLFALRPIVQRLGGTLTGVGTVTLTLGETRIVAGADNPTVLIDQEIVQLSQPPVLPEGGTGLLVPLEFLRATYGRVEELELEYSPDTRQLVARRPVPTTLPVAVDVVHLQGVSTVVLQFPQSFQYELVERPGGVDVRPRRDRFEVPFPMPRVSDPLVDDVRVSPERVRIDLARGARAESYTLERPFRLVFDVVVAEEPAEPGEEETGDAEPLRNGERDREGLHTIVIDPGHGGVETGAVGAGGVLEKNLTLELARLLQARLRQSLPVRVVLTRDEDVTLDHDSRPAVANQNKADLFISIHLNSSLGSTAHGAETYFLSSEASDARAAAAAEAENRPVGVGGDEDPLYDLQLILWDLAQSHHLSESQRVATFIQQELNSTLGLRDRGVKQAPFRVLMGAAMPAVLVELGFLSNPSEAAKLESAEYRADLVDALVRAVGRYRAELGGVDVDTPGGDAEPDP
jgi:N-acetylmuramoyl-L-alanine amidase